MPLANMRTLLAQARAQGRAVGAFSVSSLEMILGVVRAAEALRTPVILQVAQVRLGLMPLRLLGRAMLSAAQDAAVPVGVHLDHATSLDVVAQALDTGFTSVMYDGSALPLAQNMLNTQEVMRLARPYGAAVEAEVGRVGRTEAGEPSPAECADPDECVAFAAQTGVDALAVAIGNAHGVYAGAPRLRLDILAQVHARVDTPLVLHGGTGIGPEAFRSMIGLGICKINIATALFQASASAALANAGRGYFEMARACLEASQQVAQEHIAAFGVAPGEKGGFPHERAVSR